MRRDRELDQYTTTYKYICYVWAYWPAHTKKMHSSTSERTPVPTRRALLALLPIYARTPTLYNVLDAFVTISQVITCVDGRCYNTPLRPAEIVDADMYTGMSL